MLHSPVFAASNPLHFAYYNSAHPGVPTIGSRSGLLQDYAEQLGFVHDVQLYKVANTPQALVEADARSDRAYVAWRPVDTSLKVLGNNYQLTHALESKVRIRQTLPAQLFSTFVVLPPAELQNLQYSTLKSRLGTDIFVLQIDISTGGTGTYIVTDEHDFKEVLPELLASGQPIVASKFITGTSRGVQAIMVNGKVRINPWWHKDLVGLPDICDMTQPGSRYCGAVLQNIPEFYRTAIKELVAEIEESLAKTGYEGIFGLDIIADDTTGKVTLIELNARFTAVSNLYATAMRAVGYGTDFMTVHVANLLANETAEQLPEKLDVLLPNDYFYFKLQNKTQNSVVLSDVAQLGVYDSHDEYVRFGWGIDALREGTDLVVIPQTAHQIVRKPGDRTFSIIGVGDPNEGVAVDSAIKDRIAALNHKFLKAA